MRHATLNQINSVFALTDMQMRFENIQVEIPFFFSFLKCIPILMIHSILID